MIRTLNILVLAIILPCLAGNASADDVLWDGSEGAAAPYWNLPLNWSADAIPTNTDNVRAIIGYISGNIPAYGPTINVAGAVANAVDVGTWGWNGALTVTSAGTLTTHSMVVAVNAGRTGVITNSGSIAIDGAGRAFSFGAGSSTLNMNGGTLTVTNDFRLDDNNGKSHINLYGGTINVGTFQLTTDGNHTMDITGGVLVVGGNLDSYGGLNYMTNDCFVTAYGGWGTVSAAYNSGTNKTTVTASPTYVSVPAKNVYWHSNFYAKRWNRVLNWDAADSTRGYAIPRAIDNVFITRFALEPNSPIIMADEAVVVNDVAIGNDVGDANAILTVAGGTLNCNTLFIGKLSAADTIARPAHLQLDAGTVIAVDLAANAASGTIDFKNGVLVIDGNEKETIDELIATDRITAFGGWGIVKCSFDGVKTTVAAVTTGNAVSPCPLGDLTDDCAVDFEDLLVFVDQWLSTENCSGYDCPDFDGINGVDLRDFSMFAQNWLKAAQPLDRIAAQANQTDPKFYNTRTGGYFTPLGSNYVPLDWIGSVAYHTAFTTGLYNQVAAETALTGMQQSGYNIVRVFIDQGDPVHQAMGQYGVAGPYETYNSQLYKPFLDNFIDFLRRARDHNIYVIPTFYMWPHNYYYEYHVGDGGIPQNVESVSIIIFAKGAINVQKLYVSSFVQAVKDAEPDGNLLSTVFAWELANEISVNVSLKPFSLTTGTVTPADGVTYDMSNAVSRQQCMDSGILHWTNQLVSSIKAVDPAAMVSLSVFPYQAVGKTFATANGVLPRDAADPRFPGRPRSLLASSTLSYVDVHAYPLGASYSIDNELATSEYSDWNRSAKPLLMGEFGAFKSYYNDNINAAATAVAAHHQNAFDRGFKGALFWTWDTYSQTELWPLLDQNGIINNALKPNH